MNVATSLRNSEVKVVRKFSKNDCISLFASAIFSIKTKILFLKDVVTSVS